MLYKETNWQYSAAAALIISWFACLLVLSGSRLAAERLWKRDTKGLFPKKHTSSLMTYLVGQLKMNLLQVMFSLNLHLTLYPHSFPTQNRPAYHGLWWLFLINRILLYSLNLWIYMLLMFLGFTYECDKRFIVLHLRLSVTAQKVCACLWGIAFSHPVFFFT